MNNLKHYLTKPLRLQQISKWLPIIILVLALVGFADATYLTVEHFKGIIPPCSIGGCEKVLSSPYSEIFGIPVSLLGTIYYFIVLVLLVVFYDVKSEKIKDYCLKIIIALSAVGFLAAIAFIYIMLFVLHSICVYCMLSDIITITIFILTTHIFYIGLIKKYE